MPNPKKYLKKHGFLLIALGLMLVATLTLAMIQFFAVRRSETEKQATLEANLDLQLLAMVNEARRDMIERANYITHSISHDGVRDRDLGRLAVSFSLTERRYPEISESYAVFFERGAETAEWQVFRFVPPDQNDPDAPQFKEVKLGSMFADREAAVRLREVFFSIPNREADMTYTAYSPAADGGAQLRQIFYHPVYEPNHMRQRGLEDRVGLLVFTAEAGRYPSRDYLKNLVAAYEKHPVAGVGMLAASVEIKNSQTELICGGSQIQPARLRAFDSQDRLFPNLTFGVAVRPDTFSLFEKTNWTLLLGFTATGLSLLGLGLAWRANVRERRVMQMKSDFLASVSHELKTPLTSIRAFGELIETGRAKDPARIRKYGSIITTESDRLTALLNNIMEMSRLERGIRRYKLEPIDLRETVSRTVEMFRHAAVAKGFEVELLLPSAPVVAEVDENAVHQIVLNLLSNAAKYSKDCGTRIETGLTIENDEAQIYVRDFGIGIAAGEQKAIFELFYRSPQPAAQIVGGTGLGLAIVREIVAAHRGEITVDSAPGKGSLFTIHFPLAAANAI